MKLSSESYELASVSDYDGETTATFVCPRCHLSVGENYRTDRPYCKACKNLDLYLALDQATKALTSPGLMTAAFIYFLPMFNPAFSPLRYLIIPLLIIIFLPSLAANAFIAKIHSRNIPIKEQTILFLKSYNFFGKSHLYTRALHSWKQNATTASTQLRENVVRKLLEYVILKEVANPDNWIKEWAEAYMMTEEEFINFMYEVAENQITLAIKPSVNYGTITDFWGIMKDLEIKEQLIDAIANYAHELDIYDPLEQKTFIEELFVLEDELVPYIQEVNKSEWQIIPTIIAEFTPDEVPDNTMKALMAVSNHKKELQEYYARTKSKKITTEE